MGILLKHIRKSYSNQAVLSDLSLQIPDGSICAVMAPSGAGKTTLLRLLMGLEQPDSGSISGVPTKTSVLFQEDRLCPNLTIPANIRMALGHIGNEQIRSLLQMLGLSDSLQKPASQLSGGMARRAALARALLHNSNLLILDEPFRGLDDANRIIAAQAILKYQNNRTIVFVTHNEADLTLLKADQIIRL